MGAPIVSIKNLSVSYGPKSVLKNITTHMDEDKICVILGTSGCGKTTLLKTIIGLIKPTSGTVDLFGQPMTDPQEPSCAELLKKTGVVFQNGALLGSLTVAENVALPLSIHTQLPALVIDEIVHDKLEKVGMPQSGQLYPRELSGGMRKRVAMARALALDPPLLFCDEPSAGLDPVTAAGLDELLLALREKLHITIIVVTHELFSIERIADSIIFLQSGDLLFDGPLVIARKQPTGPVADFFARRIVHQSMGTNMQNTYVVENVL